MTSMLQITIPAQTDIWDASNGIFLSSKEQTLKMEHSLVSISKWESKWCKPFLSDNEKTTEEILHYIRCMTLTQNVDPIIYNLLTEDNIQDINEYIQAPMTATWFSDSNSKSPNRRIITSELIYYWMIKLNIPVEFQKWHLNRLLTLIHVCEAEEAPPKKKSMQETISEYARINAERKKRLKTRG